MPETLDVDGWLALSEGLKTERMRALEGWTICAESGL